MAKKKRLILQDKSNTVKKRGRSNKEESEQKKQRGPGRPRKDEVVEEKRYSWDEDGGMQQGLLVIILFALAAVSLLSFIQAAGSLGEWVDKVLAWGFGWARYIIPLIFALFGYIFLYPDDYEVRLRNYIGLVLFLLSGTALFHLFLPPNEFISAATEGRGGGYLGVVLSLPLVKYTGIWVTIIVTIGLFVASWLVLFNLSLPGLLRGVQGGGFFGSIVSWCKGRIHARMNGYKIDNTDGTNDEEEVDDHIEVEESELINEPEEASHDFSSKEIEQMEHQVASKDLEQTSFIPKPTRKRHTKIDIPLSLLHQSSEKPTSGDVEANKIKIQKTLENFGIAVEMGEVSVGPMVSQYTLKPAEGVKLNHITTLHDDLALALAAHPIRIEAPIPGKALVGIEVPNKAIATVTLRDMLASKKFRKRKDNLTLALGKDVSGSPYIASLQSMPHLLIAGATGSGKSVCINSVIVSLLYQNSPDDLKIILVDPKRVELTLYNGVPHLLTPVVTDVEKTVNALKWTVAEMDRRYELLSAAGKRSIEAFNSAVEEDERIPYIIFIVDELADLMSVAANSVEAAIVRLAQMSRAVGIHLVLATQRPSVNVITGLIKANMPARIAFSVASLVDSRTILDFSGAEKLLGRGDMLYIDSQLSKPKRLQGAYMDVEEIENVVGFLSKNGEVEYDSAVTEKVSRSDIPGLSDPIGHDERDELLDAAKDVIVKAGKASASLLQRRLSIGYARAARILDILEEEGFIGPAEGAKPREVLMTQQEIGEVPDDVIIEDESEQTEDYPKPSAEV